MYTFIDKELAQVKYKEMLEEAREERAERRAREAQSNQAFKSLRLAVVTVMPVAILLVWAFVK